MVKIFPFALMICVEHSRTGRNRTYGVKEGIESTYKLTSAKFGTGDNQCWLKTAEECK